MDGVVVGEASRDVRNWLPCSGCGGRGERAGAVVSRVRTLRVPEM
jgi:hypothetical protein